MLIKLHTSMPQMLRLKKGNLRRIRYAILVTSLDSKVVESENIERYCLLRVFVASWIVKYKLFVACFIYLCFLYLYSKDRRMALIQLNSIDDAVAALIVSLNVFTRKSTRIRYTSNATLNFTVWFVIYRKCTTISWARRVTFACHSQRPIYIRRIKSSNGRKAYYSLRRSVSTDILIVIYGKLSHKNSQLFWSFFFYSVWTRVEYRLSVLFV